MDESEFKAALDWLKDEIEGFFREVPDLDVAHKAKASEIREHLERHANLESPRPLGEALTDLSQMMRRWLVHVTHPRCFGYFNPSVTPASIFGDALAALYNPQIAVWSHAPAAAEIEQHVLRLFSKRFGLDPERSIANFTGGGAEANHSALIVALTRRFKEYGNHGAQAIGTRPALYLSAAGHESFVKAAHASGIGRSAVRIVPTDADLRMDVGKLETLLHEDRAEGLTPFMVIATAGTTAAGVIDPLEPLAELAGRENLWYHIDAAWGGATILSDKLRVHLAGIEKADSITCDAHKWLSVPMGAGMFFCRHPDSVLESFRVSTSYMPTSANDVTDPHVATLQWSRRFIGLKLFLSLSHNGVEGLRDMIDHQAEMGDRLRQLLSGAGWEILNNTVLPCVCFSHDKIKSSAKKTRAIASRVAESGEAWISDLKLSNDRPALRACISSYRTEVSDLERLMAALAEALS